MKKLLLILFLSIVALFLVGCNDKKGEPIKIGDTVYAIVPELKNENTTNLLIEGTVKEIKNQNGVLQYKISNKHTLFDSYTVDSKHVFKNYETAIKELDKVLVTSDEELLQQYDFVLGTIQERNSVDDGYTYAVEIKNEIIFIKSNKLFSVGDTVLLVEVQENKSILIDLD